MRQTPGSILLGKRVGRPLNSDGLPKVDTKLRVIYDKLLLAGCVGLASIDSPVQGSHFGACLDKLKDFYGCDIRWIGRGRWMLAGELDSKGRYIDYLAQELGLVE